MADESDELGYIKGPVGGVMIQDNREKREANGKLFTSLLLTLILEPQCQLSDY